MQVYKIDRILDSNLDPHFNISIEINIESWILISILNNLIYIGKQVKQPVNGKEQDQFSLYQIGV